MQNISIVNPAVTSAPKDYTVRGGQELLMIAVTANVDGTSAAGTFLPALQMIDPAGNIMWTSVNRSLPVAVGASANVSWFPGGGLSNSVTSSSAGGISAISSPNATLSVTNPTGPTAGVDLLASGVTAGTYGDATHTSQVTVNVDGIVTAASQVGISGIAGTGLVKLFDSVLGSAAASIDTGANAIPTGHNDMLIVIYGTTSQAVAISSLTMVFNGDVGAHYDYAQWTNNTGTTSSGRSAAASNIIWNFAGASNMYPDALVVWIPSYSATTFQKSVHTQNFMVDSNGASGWLIEHRMGGWRSTAAINQVAITAGSGNLVTGTRMTIYGTQ